MTERRHVVWISKDRIDSLVRDTLVWRKMADENYNKAMAVKDAYVADRESRGDRSKVESELRAASDPRFVNAVANNQMYDRFTTRDATLLTALATLKTAGLLEVRE